MQLRLGNVEIVVPPDAGIVFVFSVGWRKGMFYDFSPLLPPAAGAHTRDYDLSVLLGQYYAYLVFQDLFKITESDWASLMGQQWFPFIGLNPGTIRTMLAHSREGYQIDDLLEDIRKDISDRLPLVKLKWESSPHFKAHQEVLATAVDRYIAQDYVSAASILFTRIEGVLRSLHSGANVGTAPTQRNLVKAPSTVGDAHTRPYSLLLPDKFQSYLQEVYFAKFKAENPDSTAVINRNTVSHGVASPGAFSLKAATIGLLIVDQLSYYPAPNRLVVQN